MTYEIKDEEIKLRRVTKNEQAIIEDLHESTGLSPELTKAVLAYVGGLPVGRGSVAMARNGNKVWVKVTTKAETTEAILKIESGEGSDQTEAILRPSHMRNNRWRDGEPQQLPWALTRAVGEWLSSGTSGGVFGIRQLFLYAGRNDDGTIRFTGRGYGNFTEVNGSMRGGVIRLQTYNERVFLAVTDSFMASPEWKKTVGGVSDVD